MEKRVLGNVGTKLLLENERVRVWSWSTITGCGTSGP